MALRWNLQLGQGAQQWPAKNIGIAIVAYVLIANTFGGMIEPQKTFHHDSHGSLNGAFSKIGSEIQRPAASTVEPSTSPIDHALPQQDDKRATELQVQKKIADMKRRIAEEKVRRAASAQSGGVTTTDQLPGAVRVPERKRKSSGPSHAPFYYIVIAMFVLWRLKRFVKSVVSKAAEAVKSTTAAAEPDLKALLTKARAAAEPARPAAKPTPAYTSKPKTVSQGGLFSWGKGSKSTAAPQRASVVSRR